MPTKPRLRFEVFKRDGFTCAYCGRKPPIVTLQVDHILAESRGGPPNIDNLITSCFDCNSGKSNIPLTAIPETIEKKLVRAQEQQEQVRAYNRLLANKERALQRSIKLVAEAFSSFYPNRELTSQFKQASLRLFLEKLPAQELVGAMKQACGGRQSSLAVKYFCGICWRKIKRQGGDNG